MKTIRAFLIILMVLLAGCTAKSNAEIPDSPDRKQPEAEKISTVRISAIGDIMCHTWQLDDAYDRNIGAYDFNHNYSDVKKYFDAADIVVGNLETVTAGIEAGGYSDFPIFNSPDSVIDAAKNAGIDVLTTVNNHCMDKGKNGLLRTLDVLDAVGLSHMGTYRSPEERGMILIKEVNGMKLAFLSYTYGTNGIPVPDEFLVNELNEDLIRGDIQRAKELNPDMIIVMPHMGVEYESYPREAAKNWADIFFDAGADIILASHPHVLQPMEFKLIQNSNGTTRKGFVIYSLGNFISSQTTPPRNASIILNIDLEKTGNEKPVIKQVSFIPIWTQFKNIKGENDFVVRSVYEMLNLPEDKLYATLRKKDINRLWEIHSETTKLLLGKEVPYEQMKDEYIFQ